MGGRGSDARQYQRYGCGVSPVGRALHAVERAGGINLAQENGLVLQSGNERRVVESVARRERVPCEQEWG